MAKLFQYEAIDLNGKTVKGELEAESAAEAKSQLFAKGLAVTKLGGQTGAKGAEKGKFDWRALFEKRLPTSELILFTKQFRTLYVSGIPLAEIFMILHTQVRNKKFKEVIGDMHRRVLEGESLQGVFRAHKHIFSPLYCAMITAGEEAGALPEVTERLTYIIEHDERTQQKISSATRYPKMVVLAMLGAFLVLLNFVIPQFAQLYASSKVELPLPTQMAIWLNHALADYWWLIGAVVAGAVFAWRSWMKTTAGVIWRDTIALKLPLIGPVVQKATIARFASIFSILQRSGISVLQSLDVLKDTLDNAFFKNQLDGIKERIRNGSGIAVSLQEAKGFSPLAISLITVGENAGNLEDMLDELAKHYDTEVELAVEELTDWIGPLLILALGVVVLFFALAIFLPMWDLVKFV